MTAAISCRRPIRCAVATARDGSQSAVRQAFERRKLHQAAPETRRLRPWRYRRSAQAFSLIEPVGLVFIIYVFDEPSIDLPKRRPLKPVRGISSNRTLRTM